MSLSIPHHRNSVFSIFIFAAFTTFWVFTGKANMFFLIYIFWWDEFIQSIFGIFNRIFRKSQIENLTSYLKMLKERFFMLFIYFIFIVVIFAFVLTFSSKNLENNYITFEVLLFRNWGFNLSLLFIILREIFNYKMKKSTEKITDKNLSFGALIVLHVSIILGILLWALASGQFKIFEGIGENADKFIILPFILIKFIFDWMRLKSESN
ncbi:hypothetical protein [Moheibacter sediminis]|uniref:Uncharacterized protein n=1 Tax=Moheibacter sediminis TaxID=1434700 RepID=A0A1W1Z0Q2_9FLAO|nr:hypothetical protein [Moheibacter sediminis]SMC42047.1 hypothetical protein SAMN06296427_10289 [Moheibacter sediminis]